jgi:hypothetical protein
MDFPIEQWPDGVRSAKISLWVRYTKPDSLLLTPVAIRPGEATFPPIETSDELTGVAFRILQETPDSETRIVKVVETHPKGTPLANLYRTRVQLSHPPQKIERIYSPIVPSANVDGEVVHRFEYKKEFVNETLNLEISSESQMKQNAFTLQRGIVTLPDWNR